MKTKFLLFIFTIVCYQIQAQSSEVQQREIEQRIRRNWVKYRIEMKDGSQVPDERITKNAASMLIFKKGNVGVLISGKMLNKHNIPFWIVFWCLVSQTPMLLKSLRNTN